MVSKGRRLSNKSFMIRDCGKLVMLFITVVGPPMQARSAKAANSRSSRRINNKTTYLDKVRK